MVTKASTVTCHVNVVRTTLYLYRVRAMTSDNTLLLHYILHAKAPSPAKICLLHITWFDTMGSSKRVN